MTATDKPTRAEMKQATRSKLLQAAMHILAEEGEAGLTTTNITRVAGTAQPTFYTHFTGVQELLGELADELRARRRRTRAARAESRSSPRDRERLRETFRIPLLHLTRDPDFLRLLLRARHHDSPMGEWSRFVMDEGRREFIEDLVALGLPYETPAQRRTVAMIADGVTALMHTFALGHIEGQYPDIEEIIDVLVAFSTGYFKLLPSHPSKKSP